MYPFGSLQSNFWFTEKVDGLQSDIPNVALAEFYSGVFLAFGFSNIFSNFLYLGSFSRSIFLFELKYQSLGCLFFL